MKVAIVGGCPSTQDNAPYDDPEWEIWVHGNQYDRHADRRVSRIFEIHDDLSEHGYPLEYATPLVETQISMVVGEKFPLTADNVDVFSFQAANALMGGEHLTSTPAYMMAQAILDGATDIAIYGVDMAVDDHEYFYQRPAMYAWIAFAKARGINVTIAEGSSLFNDIHVEGRDSGGKPEYEQPPFTEKEFSAMAQLHADKMVELKQQQDALGVYISTHDGAKQTYKKLAQVARGTEAGQKLVSLSDVTSVRSQ